MFCIVAFFVINANASPAPLKPEAYQEVSVVTKNGLADKYTGEWKEGGANGADGPVWECIKSSPNELSCTGPGERPSTLTVRGKAVFLDLKHDGQFEGNIIEKDGITFDFGSFYWINGGLADKYKGVWKEGGGPVWECIKSSRNELSCTAPDGWPSTLTLMDEVVFLDLEGYDRRFEGNIIEQDGTIIDFGFFKWARQEATDQEVPLARAWPV